MKLILALGNPGDRYRDTRHNAGWWLADHLATQWSLPPLRPFGAEASADGEVRGEHVRLAKPLTYMNRCGRALEPYLREGREGGLDPERDLLVLVDDAALAPGRFRLRARGSAGGHNGLASIAGTLGSDRYARLRIGVGGPPDADVDLAAWVLSAPAPADEEAILMSLGEASRCVEAWIAEGPEAAMNAFNRS